MGESARTADPERTTGLLGVKRGVAGRWWGLVQGCPGFISANRRFMPWSEPGWHDDSVFHPKNKHGEYKGEQNCFLLQTHLPSQIESRASIVGVCRLDSDESPPEFGKWDTC